MNYHVTVGIAGLEARLRASRPNSRYGLWNVLVASDGSPMTYVEHLQEVERCKKLGYTVIPTCNKIDKFGNCKGHKSK